MSRLNRNNINGFTLIELMIVVAVIGVLAAIALPKFADMILKAKEAAIKGNLGSLRSAFAIYYADTEGFHPQMAGTPLHLDDVLVPLYIQKIPNERIPKAPPPLFSADHMPHSTLPGAPPHIIDNLIGGVPVTEYPDFHYGYVQSGPKQGRIFIMCLHESSQVINWSEY